MTQPSDAERSPERVRPTRRNDHEHSADSEDSFEDASGSTRVGPLATEWTLTRAGGATLVTVHVTNTLSAPRTVRLENRLDGPVFPPSRRGVAEAGWDEDGLTRRVPGGGRTSVGYACHAPPETPPVEVHDARDATTDDVPLDRALRSLGDHAPPRSVVSLDSPADPDRSSNPGSPRDPASTPPDEPAHEGEEYTTEAVNEDEGHTTESASEDEGHTTEQVNDGSGHAVAETTSDARRGKGGLAPPAADPSPEAVPETVTAWFRAVEARLAAADRLAGDVEEATPVVASLGGRDGIEVLATTLEADAAALARVATRASELAEHVDGADVPDLEGTR